MRIDLLLCRLRLTKSRSRAQDWIGEGHIRLNGTRVVLPHRQVAPGDVLTLPLGGPRDGCSGAAIGGGTDRPVAVIEILVLPDRRGPAREAQACYRAIDAGASLAIAGAMTGSTGRAAGATPNGSPEQDLSEEG